MKKITELRLKEIIQLGYNNSNAKIAGSLLQIINNAYSEYKNEDTYFDDKNETEIQITTKTETQENSLRGLNYLYPELVSITICLDLHSANIKNIDLLVKKWYNKISETVNIKDIVKYVKQNNIFVY